MIKRAGRPAAGDFFSVFKRLNAVVSQYWRICGTAISFAAFGIGGIVLRVAVFPVLNLAVNNKERRTEWARTIIRLAFRAFVELMRRLGVLSYEIAGRERLERRGLLILANHPSLIDTVLLMAFVKQADCIVKSALWCNPFTRGPVRAAGYISNAQGSELIDDCIRSIRNGGNLIIFPEGTRTPADGGIVFKRGAANVAVRGDCAITPVLIRCTPATLSKGGKWWKVPSTMAHFCIEIRQDIELRDIRKMSADAGNATLAARQLTSYLQHYFTHESQAMPNPDLDQEIKELIIDVLQLEDVRPADIDAAAPLFGDGLGLDSIDALELGVALQKRYGITFPANSEETRKHFASVSALSALIAGHRQQ